jgi:hypothetical protein
MIESERILYAIQNQLNITLISTRRVGKTGLKMHVFDELPLDKIVV